MFEFLEHLEEQDKYQLFENLTKNLNKNAYIFISTLNKNLLSKYLAIDIAENLLKLLPKKPTILIFFYLPLNYNQLVKNII